MSTVVVIGSLNQDLTVMVDRLPSPGETVLATSPPHIGFGGKGGNQASAAAGLGADVAMVARVGDDQAGAAVRADLASRGVDVTGVRTTPGTRTGTASITVDRTGDNMIVVDPGANTTLDPSDVRDSAFLSAAAVLVQLEIPMPAVAAAVRAPGHVVLNPAPALPLTDEILAAIDVLVPNRSELGLLSGGASPESLAAAVKLVQKLPFQFDVVVTLGAQGALVVSRREGRSVYLSAPKVNVLDTTGAGDTFCGALVVALAEGQALGEAAALAVAAASRSTTALGARGMLPTRQEAESLLPAVRREEVGMS